MSVRDAILTFLVPVLAQELESLLRHQVEGIDLLDELRGRPRVVSPRKGDISLAD